MTINMTSMTTFGGVNRVEVIDETGRAYTKYGVTDVQIETQDDGKTLKVFLKVEDNRLALLSDGASVRRGEKVRLSEASLKAGLFTGWDVEEAHTVVEIVEIAERPLLVVRDFTGKVEMASAEHFVRAV